MDYETFKERLGMVLRRRRKARELTQVQLADKVHIHQANITRLERGLQGFDSETIFRIAQALECTMTEIFYDVEQVRAPQLVRQNAIEHDEFLRELVDVWATINPAGQALLGDTWRFAREHFARGKAAVTEPRRGTSASGVQNAPAGHAAKHTPARISHRRGRARRSAG